MNHKLYLHLGELFTLTFKYILIDPHKALDILYGIVFFNHHNNLLKEFPFYKDKIGIGMNKTCPLFSEILKGGMHTEFTTIFSK